jgi:hypothetical protein
MKSSVPTLALFIALSTAGAAPVFAQTIDLASGGADPIWRGVQSGSRAGAWLDQGPLSSGDTRRDLIIGVPGGPGVAGNVYIVNGGPIRTGDLLLSSADATIHGASNGDLFGTSTAVGNILNTEGSSPRAIAIGAPGASSNRGIVYVFAAGFGSSASVSTSDAEVQIVGAPGDRLGVSLASGDLNNDGYREIIIGAPGNNRVYVIKGGPSLPSTIDLSVTAAALTFTAPGLGNVVAAGDVTGDGIYDLIAGQESANAVHLLKGRNGVMPPAAMDMIFTGIDPGDGVGSAIRLADFDSDGISDLFIGAPDADGPANSRPGAGEVYLIWGGAGVASRSLAAADVTFFGTDVNGRMGASLASGDINRDSPNDVIFNTPGSRGGAGVLYVYYGSRSHSSFGTAGPNGTRLVDSSVDVPDRTILGALSGGTITAAQVFEVTGEGARDVIVGMSGSNGNVGSVYFALSPRLSLTTSSLTIDGFQGTATSTSVDIYNISTIDISWAATSNAFWLTVTPSGMTGSTAPGHLAITANGNGLSAGTHTATIMVSSTSNHLLMSVPLTVSFVVKETQPTPTSAPVAGMPNGAIYRILWRHSTEGWLAFWNMNGVNVTGSSSVSINRQTDAHWRIAGYGDLNGDGHKDIVWQHDTSGKLAVWFLQGTTVVSTGFLSIDHTDTNWQIRAVGDTNGDGRADLIFQHKTDGWLAVWYMNGLQVTGTSFLSINKMTDSTWKIMAAGDTNGDGKADIIWQRTTQPIVAVWYLNGTQVTGTAVLSSNLPDLNWTVAGATDVNGDGRADLLLQHTNGSIATWWLNGAQVLAGSMMNPGKVSNTAWKVSGPK